MIAFLLPIFVVPFLSFVCVTHLRYADKRIVNIMKVYIERNTLQLELIRNRNFFKLYSRLLLQSNGFNGRKFQTQTTLTPYQNI